MFPFISKRVFWLLAMVVIIASLSSRSGSVNVGEDQKGYDNASDTGYTAKGVKDKAQDYIIDAAKMAYDTAADAAKTTKDSATGAAQYTAEKASDMKDAATNKAKEMKDTVSGTGSRDEEL